MLDQSDIIYFVLTDRFYRASKSPAPLAGTDPKNPFAYHGGNLDGIIEKAGYIKNLGATAVWITPVYTNIHLTDRWGYHGYWPLSFEQVDPHLYIPVPGLPEGSRQYLKRFVDAMHKAGLKVILDMVINHVGYGHPALSGSKETPIHSDWFNQESKTSVEEGRVSGLPDLDLDNVDLVDYFVNVICTWIEETGIDCIRMDTAKHVERAFWYHFKTYVKGRYPDVSLLGEVFEFDIDRVSDFQRHFAFDNLFDFPLQQAMLDVFVYGSTMTRLASPRLWGEEGTGVLDRDTHYTNHNKLVTMLDNHDLACRFFTAALSHAGGNREAALRLYKMAMALQMTTRGIPQVFYGNELALEGGGDPDNRRDMPWQLLAGGLEPKGDSVEAECFRYMKGLIALRRANPAIAYGSLTTLYVDDFLYVYMREHRGNIVIVAMNNGSAPMPSALSVGIESHGRISSRIKAALRGRKLQDLMDASAAPVAVEEGRILLKLDGKSAKILGLPD